MRARVSLTRHRARCRVRATAAPIRTPPSSSMAALHGFASHWADRRGVSGHPLLVGCRRQPRAQSPARLRQRVTGERGPDAPGRCDGDHVSLRRRHAGKRRGVMDEHGAARAAVGDAPGRIICGSRCLAAQASSLADDGVSQATLWLPHRARRWPPRARLWWRSTQTTRRPSRSPD